MPRNYQKKIVYLTEAQYQDLIADGQLVVDGQTIIFSENDLYVTPQATPLYPEQLGEGLALNDGEIEVVGKLDSSLKGSPSGLAELDSNGKVPSSQLPSYVDDVVEYDSTSNFPNSGESGKIYVAKDTNLTYRWSGSGYVEISQSLALGETEATAYRGDRGKTAYDHAAAKGSAFSSGLYKITTNAQGHVTAATAVQKADIVGLGIVDDVQVNGTSIVANDVANIPVASSSTLGVVKVASSNGIDITNGNVLYVNQATTSNIKTGTANYFPVVPAHQHEAAFYGLAKAAGDSTQASSNNSVGTYTDNAKSAIQNMLDVPSNSTLTTAITNLNIDDYVKQESDHENNESYSYIRNNHGISLGYNDASQGFPNASIGIDNSGYIDIFAENMLTISSMTSVSIGGNVVFDSDHVGQANWSPTADSDFTTKEYVDDEIAGVTTSSIGAMPTSHPANSITSSDISSWNAKVSDDKTWNGVSLTKSATTINGTSYVPVATSASPSTMNMTEYTATPGANKIAKYDSSSYLHSTTPTAGDDSTKAATTAFVGAAIGAITPASIGAMATSHAANGISSSDISNCNAKVSDDKTWNSVDLTKSSANFTGATNYVPAVSATDSTGANYMKATRSPTAHALAKYDASSYLYSTTPGSTDSSTKVATTAFVGTAIGAITAADVGATTTSDVNGLISTAISGITFPVTSVNTKTGAVTLTASDVGATTSSDVSGMIATALMSVNSFETAIVQTLPTSDIDTHTIYFIHSTNVNDNYYDEYMYINNNWEKIGTTAADISGFVKETFSGSNTRQNIKYNSATNSGIEDAILYLGPTTNGESSSTYTGIKIYDERESGSNKTYVYIKGTTVNIEGVATPTSNTMAANKAYVDSLAVSAESDENVNAMLTNMGLSTTAYFNLAAAGTAETDHAIVQGG